MVLIRLVVLIYLMLFLVGCEDTQGQSYYFKPPEIAPIEKIIFTNRQGVHLWEPGGGKKIASGEGRAVFSPDKKQLGYTRGGEAYLWNLESKQESKLGLGEFQTWLVEGKMLLLSQLGPEEETKLYLLNLSTGKKQSLGVSYGALDYPSFSAGGSLLVGCEGTGRIYLWNLSKNNKTFLGLGSNPQLSPDQKKVLYYGGLRDDNLSRLGVIDLVSKKNLKPLGQGLYLGWQPGGSKFLFAPHEDLCSLDSHEGEREDLDIYLYNQQGKPILQIGRGHFAQWVQ